MISNFFKGIAYSFQGLSLISKPGIRRFVIIPLTINISLFSIAVYLLITTFSHWLESLMPDFPGWLSWLEDSIRWLIWPLFSAMIFFILFYSFTFVANLVAAPFNSLLAQKVEAMLTNRSENNDSPLPPWASVKKSIGSEISKLFYLLKWSVIILIISFVPVINISAPFIWIIFGIWMLSLEYLDYPMGNHGHNFKEINHLARARKTLSLGFGSGSFILTSIPVINFIAMPASVAGATALWIQQDKK